jgi:uncharacterized repeat protein (TIGR01451 family)
MTVDKTQTYIGDILTYSATLNNTAGSADALNVVFSAPLPAGTTFVSGSFRVNGVVQPGANPANGVTLGTIASGTSKSVSYQVQVVSIPPRRQRPPSRGSLPGPTNTKVAPAFPSTTGP